MARIRSIKPDFCSSADTGALSRDARLFFLQLLTEADDHGRMLWLPKKLDGVLYPHDDDVTPAMLVAWMEECVGRGMLIHYRAGANDIVQIANWSRHQKVDKPTPSKLPDHSSQGVTIISREPREELASDSREPREELAPGSRKGNREREREREELSSSLRSDSSAAVAADPPSNPVEKPEPPPTLIHAPPADLGRHKAERLRQVTAEAIEAFNARLGRPNGLLPSVSARVGVEKRQAWVRRSLRVARQICESQFGGPTITAEFWAAYFAECDRDPFKSGRQPPGKGHDNWTPSFEYLTREAVMLEVFDRATSEVAA